jgi:protein-tyrosine phosphatase
MARRTDGVGARLDGYLDLHSHLLPGFDDGAKDAAEAAAILEAARQAGFGAVFATPHWMANVYEHDREAVTHAIETLGRELGAARPDVEIFPGSEYYFEDGVYERLDRGEMTPLARGKHVLVELPLLKLPPQTRDFAFRIRIKGLTPVLAHPERYADLTRDPKLAQMLVDAGFRLQINLCSLTGLYGRHVAKAAEWIVKHGLADFAGSDAHTPAQAADAFGEGMKALRKLAGDDGVRRLLLDNPRAILAEEHQ